jgi:hypothetical protein
MDYSKIIDKIADTMKRGGAPLTEDQRLLLEGSIGVYLDHAYKEGQSCQVEQRKTRLMSRCPYCDSEQTHDKLHKRFYACGTVGDRDTKIYTKRCKR